MRPAEVFLSHSDRDRDFASRIAAVLVRHGIPVWYSRRNLLGAQQWHDEIGAALARCDWFLLLLSPSPVASRWVKREFLYALEHERYEQRIVPLLYQPCDAARLSWTLSALQRVDLQADFQQGCRDLLRIWGIGYQGEE